MEITRVQALRRHVVQRDHVVGAEGDYGIESLDMCIGKDCREARNFGMGKRESTPARTPEGRRAKLLVLLGTRHG